MYYIIFFLAYHVNNRLCSLTARNLSTVKHRYLSLPTGIYPEYLRGMFVNFTKFDHKLYFGLGPDSNMSPHVNI